MKKLFTLVLGIALAYSCSTNSDNNNSSSTGLLIKTETESSGTTTYNYNGNKLSNISYSPSEIGTFTYNGELIIKQEDNGGRVNSATTYNYSNNLLSSSTGNENASNISNTTKIEID